ncbi:MAG: conserved exported protein of unknown function [Candidatus Thorarchaeota archaeon]|nr:MAG: conserved exported protein of unknown function [Candidatus Thorarchaeota archaeon]
MIKQISILILLLPMFLVPSISISTTMEFEAVSNTSNKIEIDSALTCALSANDFTLSEEKKPVDGILLFEEELTSNLIRLIESTGIHFSRRGSSIIHVGKIYLASIPSIECLHSLSKYGLESATLGDKQFYPSLMSSVPTTNAPDVWKLKDGIGQKIDGTGSTVAIIDTGIYWTHPTFWRPTTGNVTVISYNSEYYADLNNNAVADANEGPISLANEGSSNIDADEHYLFIDINDDGGFNYDDGDRWLGGFDSNDDGIISLPSEPVVLLGECKVKHLYDQYSGNVYTRGVNLTDQAPVGMDSHGHGTHVASIVAGGQQNLTSMLGAAPNADLIIVRSPLDSASIIDGIFFAMTTEADVINMSFSSYLGFLDGTDLEDIAIAEAFRKSGIISTLAAGNLGGRSKHAHMEIGPDSLGSAGISVSNPGQYSFLNVLWKSTDRDEHVVLVSPQDTQVDLGEFSQIAGNAYVLDNEYIQAYVFADVSIRGTNRIIIQIATNAHQWDTGSWRLEVTNPEGDVISVDAYAWDNNWGGTKLRFTSSVENIRTLSSPGTSDLGICVTSYDEGSEQISYSSSKGPRIDNMPISVIAAPGSSISAALNGISTLWTQRSGTSMASPHVAGVIALIKQSTGNNDGWLDRTSLTNGAGGYAEHFDTPHNSWGYGLVDALWSVRHVRTFDLTNDTTLEDLTGFNPIITDPIDSWISESLDIREVRLISGLESTIFATTFESTPDFSADNVLSIELDVDSNAGTGQNGVDYVYNVTEGILSGYEWSGSNFVLAYSIDYMINDSLTIFSQVMHPSGLSEGRFRLVTSNSTHTLDILSFTDMIDQWRPLVESFAIDVSDDVFDIEIEISDKDSQFQSFGIDWQIYDGFLSVLDSGSSSGSGNYSFSVNPDDLTSETPAISIILGITGGSTVYDLSPVVLSDGFSVDFQFVSVEITKTEFRSGFLIEDFIQGEFIIDGHLLVDDVLVSFKHSSGYYLNLTLNGDDGVYIVNIPTNSISVGAYSVYAVAENIMGIHVERFVTNITITQDNTMLFLISGVIVGVLVVIVTLRQLLLKREVT